MSDDYVPADVERRWQARWSADRLAEIDIEGVDPARKFYNLVEFPYPSAEGLHVGHAYTYTGADTYGRYLRMRGRDVFQPIGFDSFGIHTENFALRVGEHPRTLTARTVNNYRRQLRALGSAWDWSREVVTSDPSYYRWTQWIFLRLYEAGLAERRQAPVVWCPSCLTVLAHEQLQGDRCERCNTPATRKVMLQWFLKATVYAEELLAGLDELDWPDSAKRVQREWIGRSEGVEIDFEVLDRAVVLRAFTTRPDTLFGVTFLAIPPEHPHLHALIMGAPNEAEVARFVEQSSRRRALTSSASEDFQMDTVERGILTGAWAVHPLTRQRIPIYVADYVVSTYASGAIMGVPAHDTRDHAFAKTLAIPIVSVVRGSAGKDADNTTDVWTGEGVLIASGEFTGAESDRARVAIAERLQQVGAGRSTVRYRLQDWLISRQRYWGPPIPIVYCEACGTVPVPVDELPVLLPDIAEFRPTGKGASPLAIVDSFVQTACPHCGGRGHRETDVSDTFLDSSWYFLRYPSSDVNAAPWDPERTKRILPVDMYAGGPEHVMRHHLYARFITRALHDQGLLSFSEPFPRLRLHGMLTKNGAKMSKSRGNVVNPDVHIAAHGADVTRMYLLFIGPWEQGGDFSDSGIAGIERFLRRVWRIAAMTHAPGPGNVDLRPLDRAIAAVGADLEELKFNTAIASLMEIVRWAREQKSQMSVSEWNRVIQTIVLMLAPFAPHLAEELWWRNKGHYSVHQQAWPEYDELALVEETIALVIQVNGKTRDVASVRGGLGEGEAVVHAKASPIVRHHIGDRDIQRVVFVPDRLINLVV